jgi:hypothetical protein
MPAHAQRGDGQLDVALGHRGLSRSRSKRGFMASRSHSFLGNVLRPFIVASSRWGRCSSCSGPSLQALLSAILALHGSGEVGFPSSRQATTRPCA